jgi:hypothetical protein
MLGPLVPLAAESMQGSKRTGLSEGRLKPATLACKSCSSLHALRKPDQAMCALGSHSGVPGRRGLNPPPELSAVIPPTYQVWVGDGLVGLKVRRSGGM